MSRCFLERMYTLNTDTIAAIATAVNHAGISIIRISGSDSLAIIDRIYVSKNGKKIGNQKSHTIHYGFIKDGQELIDEVMVSIFIAPHSYTAEDTIEINCHGGIIVTKKVLDTVLRNGARPALPGEFTKRAFLNGRIDLSQAEAVMDLIQAKSDMALKSSVMQVRGSLFKKIRDIRQTILRDLAFIEAALDDPEHIELDGFSEELRVRVLNIEVELEHLLSNADNGKIIKEGIKTVILGKPNAGKSSLLNRLLGEDRAIVTDIEGTTRDTLEESLNLGGVICNLVDTAGIRDAKDIVEKMGVEKAKQSALAADLIIYVVDVSRPLDENDQEILRLIEDKKSIIILNKIDLISCIGKEDMKQITNQEVIEISAKSGEGISELEKTVNTMFLEGNINFNDEIYISNARQKYEMEESLKSLRQVIVSIEEGLPEDFYTIDLMSAYESLGRIIGEAVGEDVIHTIFKEFCMGK
ncbi:MAG: tRNA modification GTPase [Clostridiales bacterium]|nr:tRNA modification GTPase [Clostridiales bacterium]